MKKNQISKIVFLLVLSVVSCLLSVVGSASAQTATTVSTKSTTPTKTVAKTTPSPTLTPQDKQIEKIKDLVASRVAELKLVDKRAILGTVKTSSNSQITVDNVKGVEQIIEIDELTKFEGSGNESFGISDVEKGDMISAIGLFNKQTEKLLARFVELASNIPLNINGVVTDKNPADFTITISDEHGDSKIVNIETSTKTSSYEEGKTIKSGYTKILEGDRVIVVGFADKTRDNEINASRILRLPDIPAQSKTKSSE